MKSVGYFVYTVIGSYASQSAEGFIDVAINFQLFNYVSFVRLNCCCWFVFIVFRCSFLHFSVEL